MALLDRLPLERVAYVHVAGGAEHDGLYHDTHTDAVPAAGARPGRRAVRPAPAAGADAGARRRTTRRPPSCAPSWTRSPPRSGLPGAVDVTARRTSPADRQAALVAALVAGRAGAGRLRRRAGRARPGGALLRKRAGEVARHWPLLAAGVRRAAGRRRSPRGRPAGPPQGSLRDGWDLARELRRPGRACRRWPPRSWPSARRPGATTAAPAPPPPPTWLPASIMGKSG